MRLLAAHDRSEQEVRTRLATLGVAAATIDDTVERLRAARFLDERRFAFAAAEQACRRGRGSERVRAELAAKGVADSLADEAIRLAFRDEVAVARRALTRRYGAQLQQAQARGRAARFLRQRGFPEAVVLAILGEGC